MATKKPTIAARPVPKSQEDFLNRAAQNLETATTAGDNESAKKEKPNKKQIPLLIPGNLLDELDAYREEQGTGISRSAWICQAIRKQLDAQK
jgi:hypothetical protein